MQAQHVKSLTYATSTDTTLINASDWNSSHNHYYTLSGNTAGSSTVSGPSIVFQGGNNITLSGTGSSIIVSAGAGRQSSEVMVQGPVALTAIRQKTLWVMPIAANGMIIDRVIHYVSVSIATTVAVSRTISATVAMVAGLYTKNASTLTLVLSGQSSYLWSQCSITGSTFAAGMRAITVPLATTMDGQWWLGVLVSTATATAGAAVGNSFSELVMTQPALDFSGILGVASATTNQMALGLGSYSVTTAGMPASIRFNEIKGTGSNWRSLPYIILANQTA